MLNDLSVIEQHLPLVRHIVFQVAVRFPRHVDREELARAGTLGLVEAAHRYDDSRGVPFERFAAQRIRGAILDAVRSADWAPRSLRSLARTIDRADQDLVVSLGRRPTLEEMAEALQLTAEQLNRLQGRIHRSVVLALDHPLGDADDEVSTLGDTVPSGSDPGEELEQRELRAYLRDAIDLLPERLRLIVIGYFREGRTSAELARFLGVTESRISQLRSEALAMLREAIEAQYQEEVVDVTEQRGAAARRAAVLAAALRESSPWRERLDEIAPDA